MTSLIFPTVMVGVSTGLGYVVELAGLEAHLRSVLPTSWLVDPNVLLCVIAFGFFFLQTVLGSAVSSARRQYGVDYPVMYPELKDVSTRSFFRFFVFSFDFDRKKKERKNNNNNC